MIRNRLEKNAKRLRPWAERLRIEAYRLYDRDIPEYPFIVDRYAGCFILYDRGDARNERDRERLPEMIDALRSIFGIDEGSIFVKARARQKGEAQYEKLGAQDASLTVREGDALFRVNLSDYLDTGLFLDHRLVRDRARRAAQGKSALNLFSYTGSISVCAALGGAHSVTSVDMSATYCRWAQNNFNLNNIDLKAHEFIQADALAYLGEARGKKFDLIFLDPPTFSNSKRMTGEFEVERDQESLVASCMARLTPGGQLWFSCNKRTFRLSPVISEKYNVCDVTDETIPFDFRDRKIHRAYEISSLAEGT